MSQLKLRAIAQVFYAPGTAASDLHIHCAYCGYEANGDSMEEVGADFWQHMFFGEDTSASHFRYAAGIGRSRQRGRI